MNIIGCSRQYENMHEPPLLTEPHDPYKMLEVSAVKGSGAPARLAAVHDPYSFNLEEDAPPDRWVRRVRESDPEKPDDGGVWTSLGACLSLLAHACGCAQDICWCLHVASRASEPGWDSSARGHLS